MTPERFAEVAAIFDSLFDLPAAQRQAELDRLAPETRAAVQVLLARDDETAAQIDTMAFARSASVPIVPKLDAQDLPSQIGPYEVLGKLGEGGMGIVLEARQTHPDRRVAIKLLRGVSSPELHSRFEREIRILGQLQHPSIAHIYAADLLPLPGGGVQPYFVMEYIDGLPVHRYVARHNLRATEKLELMASICDAVAYAHQQGVLHRDLKPGNIMVTTRRSGVPAQPKILDFGVGRLMDQDSPQATLHTQTGRLVGTLAYMSPEQVHDRSSELDQRSDVYALGVILYELLANRLPVDVQTPSLGESLRRIRDQEPQSLASVDPLFRGDIDTIVATAMHKDRSKRYASAAAFASDIRRVLRDEPIVARPATRMYQLRKLVRRHRGITIGLGVAFLTLALGVVATSWQALEAMRARDAAEHEARRAVQIKDFLQEIIASAAPDQSPSDEISAVSLLDTARERLDHGELAADPDVQSELRITLARGYLSLGHYALAEETYRQAEQTLRGLGTEPLSLAQAIEGRGAAHELQNQYDLAEAAYREAMQIRVDQDGAQRFPAGLWPHGLAAVLYFTGRFDEAEQAYRDAIVVARRELGDEHIKVAQALGGLGVTLEAKGESDEAIDVLREAAVIYRAAQGDQSIHFANCLNNLGNALQGRGDVEEAIAAQREALAIRQQVYRANHPDIAMSLGNLALVLRDQGQLQEAESMMRQSLAIRREVLPPVHHSTAVTLHNLGTTLVAQERYSDALEALHEAVAMAEQAVPPGHLMLHVFRANRGYCQFKLGNYDAAEAEMRPAYEAMVTLVGRDHRRTRKIADELVELYAATDRPDEAQQLLAKP